MLYKRIVCEIRFSPVLDYAQKQIEIANKYLKEYHWEKNSEGIYLYNKEKRRKIILNYKRAAIAFENERTYGPFCKYADVLIEYCEKLKINKLLRQGVAIYYIYEESKGRTFENIKDTIIDKSYTSNIKNNIKNIKDIAFVLEGINEGYNFNLEFGPVKREEIKVRFKDGDFGEENSETLPETGILFCIDRYNKNCDIDGLKSFIESADRESLGIVEPILKEIL